MFFSTSSISPFSITWFCFCCCSCFYYRSWFSPFLIIAVAYPFIEAISVVLFRSLSATYFAFKISSAPAFKLYCVSVFVSDGIVFLVLLVLWHFFLLISLLFYYLLLAELVAGLVLFKCVSFCLILLVFLLLPSVVVLPFFYFFFSFSFLLLLLLLFLILLLLIFLFLLLAYALFPLLILMIFPESV